MKQSLSQICTAYYESKTRTNKYGNYCEVCTKEVKGECYRAIFSVNSYNGFVDYVVCHKNCFMKSLSKEIAKLKKTEAKRRKDFEKSLIAVKKLLKKMGRMKNA